MEKDERYYSAYLAHNQISRRGLLRSLFTAPQPQHISEKRQANRPPFAAKESLFLAVCTGCGECVKACPYGLIELQQHYPVLDLQFSACDFCQACVEACPTKALHPAFKADTELRPQFLSTCVYQQGQRCTTCIDVCSTQAIQFNPAEQLLQLNAERCNGCGECKIGCFMQAIELENQFT
ncbi:hypothetical protein QV06_03295 [Gallibacterium genomosp. 3]|uniref:4Fe-4S ferredoxin-type domain-containing protein n=1 Tax=Gallibacterium genomosp. 3 TaxID=505345 RepID=A0A1A7PT61_9PAST|nr:ferredoxin-type protein NapF [Gallibacterium genomosp. 3]OBX05244.1 hypothetical protein QV06_03295 [Gallibacterium genomosp. 3]